MADDRLSNPINLSKDEAEEAGRISPPFMRSRMKHSLSGVWKAYVIHTMNGQS